jgi:integrase
MAKVFTQAGVEKLKKTGKRRDIPDGGSRALFISVYPSGTKSWMMRFRRGSGASRFVIGPLDISGRIHVGEPEVGQPLSLAMARQLSARICAERASGKDVVADYKARKHRRRVAVNEAAVNSFAAAARDYVTEYAKPKVRRWEETARNLGLDAELNVRRGGLADRWGDRSMKDIDAHDLFAVVEEARKFGVPGIAVIHDRPAEGRSRTLFAALSQLFGWCLRTRRIDANPMISLTPPRPPKARDRVLSDAEIKAFWAATGSLNGPFGAVLKLLLLTGCRLNEIAELPWDEVSEDNSTITISGDRTKNRLPLVLVLPPTAQDLIRGQERNGPFVFTTNGIAPVSVEGKIKRRLDAAMGKVPAWRLHDLRRTAATHMAEIGIQPHIIEAILNHVSGHKASVAGVYNRAVYAAEKKAALENWEAYIKRLVAGTENVVPIRRGR